ncbi:MAG TPA: hypothetical protein ENO00_06795 [Deltaproteobacteria bacterium]|nr:hypothetical protein [Deltaproteobacteria bacterium]
MSVAECPQRSGGKLRYQTDRRCQDGYRGNDGGKVIRGILSAQKPLCSRCPVHCYKPDMRNSLRAVMHCAGPRMCFRHPVLSGIHYGKTRREGKK